MFHREFSGRIGGNNSGRKRTRIGLRLIVTLKVVNSRQTAFGILPITKSLGKTFKWSEILISHLMKNLTICKGSFIKFFISVEKQHPIFN